MKIEAPRFEQIAVTRPYPQAWQPLLCVGEFGGTVYAGSTRVRIDHLCHNKRVDQVPATRYLFPNTLYPSPIYPYDLADELAAATFGRMLSRYPVPITGTLDVPVYEGSVEPSYTQQVKMFSDHALWIVTASGDLVPDESLPDCVFAVPSIQVQPDAIYAGCGVVEEGKLKAAVYRRTGDTSVWTRLAATEIKAVYGSSIIRDVDSLEACLRYPVTGIQVFAGKVIFGSPAGLFEASGGRAVPLVSGGMEQAQVQVWQVAKWRSNILFWANGVECRDGDTATQTSGWFSLYPLQRMGGSWAGYVPENSGASVNGEWMLLSRVRSLFGAQERNSVDTLEAGTHGYNRVRMQLPDGRETLASIDETLQSMHQSGIYTYAKDGDIFARNCVYDGVFRWEGVLYCFGQDFRNYPSFPWWDYSVELGGAPAWLDSMAAIQYETRGTMAAFAMPYFVERLADYDYTIQAVFPQEAERSLYAIAHPNAKMRFGPIDRVARGYFSPWVDCGFIGGGSGPDAPTIFTRLGSSGFEKWTWPGYGAERLEDPVDIMQMMWGGDSQQSRKVSVDDVLVYPTTTVDTTHWLILRASQKLRSYWAGYDWSATATDNKPTVSSATVEYADGSSAHKPTVTEASFGYSDGSGGNKPTVASAVLETESRPYFDPEVFGAEFHFSDGSGTNKPTVSMAEYEWSWDIGVDPETQIVMKVTSFDASRLAYALTVVPNLPLADWSDLVVLYRVYDELTEWPETPDWQSFTRITAGATVTLSTPGLCVLVAVIAPNTVSPSTTVNIAVPREEG